ncbi:hypothetical protein LTR17_000569 [Elasticomyces elasticus]|nr:hypothetical protein LTR17_000569 [Elasticomyces elasticus]
MPTDTVQGVSSLDGLSSILAKMCEAQITLTHSANELVVTQQTTNELISKLIKDNMAGREERVAAGMRIEGPTNGDEKEQNTGVLDRIPPNVVLSPFARVIGTFELLEQILLDDEVSMQTVLFAQRVNTTFLATITNSKSLQRKLFFAPPSGTASHQGRPILNGLLVKKSVLDHLPLWLRKNSESEFECRGHVASPFHIVLTELGVHDVPATSPDSATLPCDRISYLNADLQTQYAGNSTHIIERGSWQRMYLTQPPCAMLIQADCSLRDPQDPARSRRTSAKRFEGWSIIREPGTLSDLLRSLKLLEHGSIEDRENMCWIPGYGWSREAQKQIDIAEGLKLALTPKAKEIIDSE